MTYQEVKRGDPVIVRTYGGYPRIRRIWGIDGAACLVVEDRWFRAVEEGDLSYIVSLPLEDVFRFKPDLPLNPQAPFTGWGSLQHIAAY